MKSWKKYLPAVIRPMESHENISPPTTSDECPTGSLGLKREVNKDQRAETLHPLRPSLANPTPPVSPRTPFSTLPRINIFSPTSPIDPTPSSKESKIRRFRLFSWLNPTGITSQNAGLGNASDTVGEIPSAPYSTMSTPPTSRSVRSMDIRHLDPPSRLSSSLSRSAPYSNRGSLPSTPRPVDMPKPRPRLALGGDLSTSSRPLSTKSLPVNTFQPTVTSNIPQASPEQQISTHSLLLANPEHSSISKTAAVARAYSGGPSLSSLGTETQSPLVRKSNLAPSAESVATDTGASRHSMVSPLARYSFSLQEAEISDIGDQTIGITSETSFVTSPLPQQRLSTPSPRPIPVYRGRSSIHTVTPLSTRESLVSPSSDSSVWDASSVRSRNTIPSRQSRISINTDTPGDGSIGKLSKMRLKQATRQLQELAGKSLAYVCSTGHTPAEPLQNPSRAHSLDNVPVLSDRPLMSTFGPESQPDLRVGIQPRPEPFTDNDDELLRYYDPKLFPTTKGTPSPTSDRSSLCVLDTSQSLGPTSRIKPRLSISTSVSTELPGPCSVRVSSLSSTDSNRLLDTIAVPISPTPSSPRSLYYRSRASGASSPIALPGPLSHPLPTDASSSFTILPTLAVLSEMSAHVDPAADERLFSTPIPKPFAQPERVQEGNVNQASICTTSTEGTLIYPPSPSAPVSPRSVYSQSSFSTGNRSAYSLYGGEGLATTSVSEFSPHGPPGWTASQDFSPMDDDSPLALALALLADDVCVSSFLPPRPERSVDTEYRRIILSNNRRVPLFIVQSGYTRDGADHFVNSTFRDSDSARFLATATNALHRSPNLSIISQDAGLLGQGGEPRVTCDQILREASLACNLHDHPKATRLYRNAALHGSFYGLFLYGLALWAGWGCPADPLFALQCLEAAVDYAEVEISTRLTESSYPEPFKRHLTLALYELALCHQHGWGTPVELVRATYYFNTTALLGDPDAQDDLACCYLDGQGVTRNMHSVTRYFSQADRQGNWLHGSAWFFKRKYLMHYSSVT